MIKLTDQEVAAKLLELESQVRKQLPGILDLASFVLGRELTVQQFHAIIGAKNNHLLI